MRRSIASQGKGGERTKGRTMTTVLDRAVQVEGRQETIIVSLQLASPSQKECSKVSVGAQERHR